MLSLSTSAVLTGHVPEMLKAIDKLLVLIISAISGSRDGAQGSAARLLAALAASEAWQRQVPTRVMGMLVSVLASLLARKPIASAAVTAVLALSIVKAREPGRWDWFITRRLAKDVRLRVRLAESLA